jgi:hypothetical protein
MSFPSEQGGHIPYTHHPILDYHVNQSSSLKFFPPFGSSLPVFVLEYKISYDVQLDFKVFPSFEKSKCSIEE